MKENCIITLGIGKNYPRGVERLRQCIIKHRVDCDFFGYTEYPEGIPTHQEIPYAFKYFLMQQKLDMGYKRVVWVDVSLVPLNNLDFFWKHLDKWGYLVYAGAHTLDKYTTDKCFDAFNVAREVGGQWLSTASGIFGVSRESELGLKLVKDLCWYAQETEAFSTSKPHSKNPNISHRPCQSTLTIICYQNGADHWLDLNKEAYTFQKQNKSKGIRTYERYYPNKSYETDPKYQGKNFLLDRIYVKRMWY